VVNNNASLKGITLYGDANQSVGIGVVGNKVQLWEVKDNHKKILAESLTKQSAIRLRMLVAEGFKCRFFWSRDGVGYHELKAAGQLYYNGKRLPPWDRSPRPGLFHFGNKQAPAAFSFFSITYLN
jgi:hypothetical protein